LIDDSFHGKTIPVRSHHPGPTSPSRSTAARRPVKWPTWHRAWTRRRRRPGV